MHWAVISIQMLYEFWSIITYAIVYATLIYGVIGSANSWVSSGESGFKGELNSDYVHCCRELLSASSTAAIIGSCVFHAAAAAEQKAFHDAYTAQGPLLRVLMVTYATNGLIEYSAYSTAVNAAYAQYNGYTFRALNESSLQQVIEDKDLFSKPADVDERWFKVKILEHTIAYSDADYVVWLDADLIVTRFEVRVEQIMASHPNAYIILCAGEQPVDLRDRWLVNQGSCLCLNL